MNRPMGKGRAGNQMDAQIARRLRHVEGARVRGHYDVVCRNLFGDVKWVEAIDNIVVNEGLDYLLEAGLDNQTQLAAWYVGLLATSPSPLAGWLAADIATNDFVAYTEGVLQTFVGGTTSGQSLDNVGNEASFSINADSSVIGGAFLISTDAKATPAGTLYSAGAFSGGDKNADDGDTLTVTATFTMADDAV